ALDPQTTDEILDLLLHINKKYNLTIVLITHEMHVIQKICHRVAVMENGTIVEQGDVLDVFTNPVQPVTQRFVKQVVNDDESHKTVVQLLTDYPDGKIVLIKYIKDKAAKPFISDVIRKYNVDINIIHGKVVQTQDGEYGSLYVQFTGVDVDNALTYLQNSGLEIEVMVR
ncbi:MAG: NIL domain-containing protein, partial [Turicibacter sp.]